MNGIGLAVVALAVPQVLVGTVCERRGTVSERGTRVQGHTKLNDIVPERPKHVG